MHNYYTILDGIDDNSLWLIIDDKNNIGCLILFFNYYGYVYIVYKMYNFRKISNDY
jgi:hypothetical protein